MIEDIRIRRVTCDRCNSSFEYLEDNKFVLTDKFAYINSLMEEDYHQWDLCRTCYMSLLSWLNIDGTKTRPEKLRGSDNG